MLRCIRKLCPYPNVMSLCQYEGFYHLAANALFLMTNMCWCRQQLHHAASSHSFVTAAKSLQRKKEKRKKPTSITQLVWYSCSVRFLFFLISSGTKSPMVSRKIPPFPNPVFHRMSGVTSPAKARRREDKRGFNFHLSNKLRMIVWWIMMALMLNALIWPRFDRKLKLVYTFMETQFDDQRHGAPMVKA